MSVIENFNTTNRGNTNGSSRSMRFRDLQNPEDRPAAKVWMNIGREVNGKFINLPIGLPIDTMHATEIRSVNRDNPRSVEWAKQATAQNQLLEALQKAGLSMEPGEEQIVNLQVRIRRVNEKPEIQAEDNEFTVDLSTLFVSATDTVEEAA